MALRIEHIVTDDLDASTDGVGTYRFALEGVDYEIDLSESNLHRLRDALAPFVTAGRRLPRQKNTHNAVEAKQTVTGQVRSWWAVHVKTYQLPSWRANGPIPRTVYDAHREHAQR